MHDSEKCHVRYGIIFRKDGGMNMVCSTEYDKNITKYYRLSEIVDVIEKLDEKIRLIGKLYICGFSEQEIADRLNTSSKNVKRNIAKVKRELKKNQIKQS